MTTYAIILVVVSAFMHASWNFIGKREHPSAAFFLVANLTGVVCLAPGVIWYGPRLGTVPAAVWAVLAVTGLCMAVYYLALAAAYRAGDMSIAYPLARSAPVLIVALAAIAMGKSDQLSTGCLAGIVLILIGAFLLPMHHLTDVRLGNYLNLTCGLALLAACGTAGYSMLDDHGLRLLREQPDGPFDVLNGTILYISLESIATSAWMAVYVLRRSDDRRRLMHVLARRKRAAATMGVGIFLTYGLVLASMAYVTNISYVVALRQLSIPIGVLLGVVLLQELGSWLKWIGVFTVLGGLALVSLA